MYRAGLESILGFQLRVDRLRIDPCVPRWWRTFEIIYRYQETTYFIKVENPMSLSRGIASVEVDEKLQEDDEIRLVNDHSVHQVRIVLGEQKRHADGRQETATASQRNK